MSRSEEITREVIALHSGDPTRPIHRDRLRELTADRYIGAGANGGLFGFRYPWMVKRGELRFVSEHGRRRLGL